MGNFVVGQVHAAYRADRYLLDPVPNRLAPVTLPGVRRLSTAFKQRIRPMLGFKRFDNAVVTISGIDLAERIKKAQFKTGKLGAGTATMTELWNAATHSLSPNSRSLNMAELTRSLRRLEFAPEPSTSSSDIL
jgi:hypothetical protein